jgi:hypothetical protein
MQRPFELSSDELRERLEEMVQITISDLASEFLLMPMGSSFIKYPDFRAAYEVLKRHTVAFTNFTETAVGAALRENSRALGVLRAILGMTPPEWAELARTEGMSDITQGRAPVKLGALCPRSGRGRHEDLIGPAARPPSTSIL